MAGRRARRRSPPSPPVPTPESRSARRWLGPALVVLAALAAHANGLFGDLVFDANAIVEADPRIREVRWANLIAMLGGPYWYGQQTNLFRPLTTLSYWLNYSVMGLELRPFGYHATNVALHALNAALLLRLGTRLGLASRAAAFAALVFAWHPLTSEAVANVVGRADLLAATCVLGALLLHTRPVDRHGGVEAARALGIGALTLLAVLSKESGVVVPAALLLYDLLLRRAGRAALPWPRYVAAGVALAAAALWRSAVFRGEYLAPTSFVDNPLLGAAPGTWQLTAFQVVARYALLLVAPIRLSADYSFDEIPLYGQGTLATDVAAWAGLLLAAGLLALAWARRRASPIFSFGIGFASAAFLPASNLIVRIGTIMGERLLYLPLAGFAVALAAVAADRLAAPAGTPAPARRALRVAGVAAGIAWLALLAARTGVRNADWASDERIFAATAAASPRSAKMQQVLAELELERARREGTLTRDLDAILARQALAWSIMQRAALEHRHYRVPSSLARMHLLRADLPGTSASERRSEIAAAAEAWQAAVDIYRRQWQLERGNAEAAQGEAATGHAAPFVGLAEALALLERYDEAERVVEEAREIAPLDPAPLAIGSALARRRGGVELATQRAFERVLLEPGSAAAWQDVAALRPSAVLQTPEGPRLDAGDAQVRADLEAAFRDLIARLRAGGHAALARQVLAASAGYGLSRDAVDVAAPVPDAR